jgi:acetyl esterase/lipase
VTLIVVAVLFGVRTVVFGGSLLWRGGGALFGRTSVSAEGSVKPAPVFARGVLAAGLRWTAAVVVLALTAGVFTVSHALREGAPVVDAFYTAPTVIPSEPGVLLRWSPYTTGLPVGVSAWRVLYTTTTGNGASALASGVVAIPQATGAGPRPVIAWNHGTNGIAQGCAPSLTPNAISPEAIPALDAVVRNGWAIVATDYTGEGTEGVFPYLVGQAEARSSLDAVRAAHQLPSLNLSDQTVIWGHSQGGHATLWAAQIAPSYAPDLKIVGTAALSPASNPVALAADITAKGSAGPVAVVTSFLLSSYARSYDDVKLGDYVATSARTLVQEMAARCATEPGALVSVLNSMAVSQDQPLFRLNLTTGPLADRLTENIPTGPFPQPLFIGQGDTDEVIAPAIQNDYVARLCAAGQPLEYQTYPGKSHMGVVAPDSPLNTDLEQWTRDRLNGVTAEDNCPH